MVIGSPINSKRDGKLRLLLSIFKSAPEASEKRTKARVNSASKRTPSDSISNGKMFSPFCHDKKPNNTYTIESQIEVDSKLPAKIL